MDRGPGLDDQPADSLEPRSTASPPTRRLQASLTQLRGDQIRDELSTMVWGVVGPVFWRRFALVLTPFVIVSLFLLYLKVGGH